MTPMPDVRSTGTRVDQLLDSLTSAADPELRTQAEELAGLLVQLYGAGLNRIISFLGELSPGDADRLIDLMIEDELVSGLMVLHGLHPHGIRTRVQAAIDGVLPSLGHPMPTVELLSVDEAGVARLRWSAAASGSTLPGGPQRLEATIMKAVADVTAVEIEQTTGDRRRQKAMA